MGNCKISRMLFADDLVLLFSTESGLQRTVNSFADVFDATRIKISMAKTEVLHLSRNPDQRSVRVASEWSDAEAGREVQVPLGFISAFTSDGRQDEKLDTIGKASAVMRALHFRLS